LAIEPRRKYKLLELLNRLVVVVGRLDKTDGVMDEYELPPPTKREKHSSDQPRRSVLAMGVITVLSNGSGREGDSNPPSRYGLYVPPTWVNAKTKCYKCKEQGHIGSDPACTRHSTPLGEAAMAARASDAA
jgi:hypothetical protein